MSHTALFHAEKPQLDASRIVGISAAVLLNAALAMVLLRPVSFAPLIDVVAPTQPVIIIEPLPVQPKPPVDPVAIKPKPVEQHISNPSPTSTILATTQQQIAIQPTMATQDPIGDTVGPETIDVITTQATPIEATLAYSHAPAPAYPRDPLRSGIQGTVQLRVLVDTNGAVLDVQIEHSSGNRELDQAAREQVLHNWRFQPAQRNGVRMQAWGRVPIVFTLGGN